MKKYAAMYRPLEGEEFNLDMVECESDVTDFQLYNDFGKGAMVVVWFPVGFDFDEAFELAGSEAWGDVVARLLTTEAKNTLISTGYKEFAEIVGMVA